MTAATIIIVSFGIVVFGIVFAATKVGSFGQVVGK